MGISDMKAAFDMSKPEPQSKSARLVKYNEPVDAERVLMFRGKIQRLVESVARVDVREKRFLTQRELELIREEYESLEDVALIIEARKTRIKDMVFNHIETETDQIGVDPEVAIGEIEIGDKKFKKEGGGRKPPLFDLNILKERFSEEEYANFVDLVSIPEYTIQKVNEEKLDDFLSKNPGRMEDIRDSLIPGPPKPFKFAVRSVKDDYEE